MVGVIVATTAPDATQVRKFKLCSAKPTVNDARNFVMNYFGSQTEVNAHTVIQKTRTSAPLLSRIMNMMKDSNQLCSTMIKQVFLRFHQFL